MKKFDRTLTQYTELAERLALWKQIQNYLAYFLIRDTDPEPRQTLTVQIPRLGTRQISQESLQRVDSEVSARIEEILQQITSLE